MSSAIGPAGSPGKYPYHAPPSRGPFTVPLSPVTGSGPLLRVTPDHLKLIRALVEAGQFDRALEMLEAVWHPDRSDEQISFLKIWLLIGQGRVVDALEVARAAVDRLPGSAAVAHLQGALELAQ